MSKKRVHEIAKERGIPTKEVLAKLNAAGIEAKAAQSTVEEADAAKALGNGKAAPAAPARARAARPDASGQSRPGRYVADPNDDPSSAGGSGAAAPSRPRRVPIDGGGSGGSGAPARPAGPRRVVIDGGGGGGGGTGRSQRARATGNRSGAPAPQQRVTAPPPQRRQAAVPSDPRIGTPAAAPPPAPRDPRRDQPRDPRSADGARRAGGAQGDPRRAGAGERQGGQGGPQGRAQGGRSGQDPRNRKPTLPDRIQPTGARPGAPPTPTRGQQRGPAQRPQVPQRPVPADPRRATGSRPGPVPTDPRRGTGSRPGPVPNDPRKAAPPPAQQPPAAAQGGDAAKPAARPTRDSLAGERAPGGGGGGPGRRRVVIDSTAGRKGPGGGGPPPFQPPRRRGGRRGRRGRQMYEEQGAQPAREFTAQGLIRINSGSTVKDVAEYLGVPVPEIIKKLMGIGEMATLTQTLSDDAIQLLAEEFEKEVEVVRAADEVEEDPVFEDADEDLVERPPVVTIMGHVDHGKTSLLDAIRQTEVAAGEAGGITQHIGAYQVHHGEKLVTFLDTPGHEAFTAMRARGAKGADIAIIVVAADDGVKPQTQEAVDHAKAAGVPMLVAINKIDKEGAQPDRVRGEMANLGLQPADWGGETEFVHVSAKTKDGLDDLVETVLVMAEVEELRANPNVEASGSVIESKLDPGRGAVVTVLIQRGTLAVGDAVVAGAHWGRVRAMQDYMGKRVKTAGPGDPVEVLGFDSVPEAGEFVRVTENDRAARTQAAERANRIKTEALARRGSTKISLEDIFSSGASALNLLIKVDVAGSLEAIEDEIAKLPQSEVGINIVRSGVGGVTESDVMLAAATNAIVLGFNVRPVGEARIVSEREGVEVRSYAVIYRAIDDLRAALEGMLEPEEVEEGLGSAEVRQTFRASRVGVIAGCYITEGTITRGSRARLVRDGTVVYDGEIASLRRFNDDVREVASGFECGIVLRDYADVKDGDVIEAYTTKKVERELQ